jgi:hypothetical protein
VNIKFPRETLDARCRWAQRSACRAVCDPNPENRDSGKVKTKRFVVSSAGRPDRSEEPQMRRQGRSNEEIIHALHQVEGGEKVTEVCRRRLKAGCKRAEPHCGLASVRMATAAPDVD